MAVTFDRLQLIEVTKEALAKHEKAQQHYVAEGDRVRAKHSESKVESTRSHALKLRDTLTNLLKKKGPVSVEDLKKALDGHDRLGEVFFTPLHDYDVRRKIEEVPQGLLNPAQVTMARTLLSVLGAATGETVSANELKLLGLRDLQPIFTAASDKVALASKATR